MTDSRKLTPRQQLVKEGTEYLFSFYNNLCRVYHLYDYESMQTGYYYLTEGYYKPISRPAMEKELENQFKFRLNNAAVKEIFSHLDRQITTKRSKDFDVKYRENANTYKNYEGRLIYTEKPIGYILKNG